MIAVDTNLLLYAHREDSEWHSRAAAAVKSLAESLALWAIPWPCIHEFLAITTHPKIYNPPTPIARALLQVEAWSASPSLVLLSETTDYWAVLRSVLESGRVAGPQVHDARVAALCLSGGVRELWTADRDFSRFPNLPVRNPLVS